MRPRSYKTSGVALRQYPLGEADRIFSILTPDHGKVRVVARSVRRPRGRLRGHLDLTNVVSFSASYGRDLDVVTEAMILDGHEAIRADLSRLSQALYVCELADLFAEERSPSRALYDLVVLTLEALGYSERVWLLVRWFEHRLLEITGFRPELERCVECGDTLEPADHAFAPELGGTLCPACRARSEAARMRISQTAMRVLRHLQRARSPRQVGALELGARLMAEVEGAQARYIRSIVERDIRSADFTRRAANQASG